MASNVNKVLLASVIMMGLSAPAFAQDATTGTTPAPTQNGAGPKAGTETQLDVNQQNRVEQGLQSGQLSTGEAAKIEKGETRIDNTEARDMKKGPMTSQEEAHIQKMQNNEGKTIYRDKHNAAKGDADSTSSERMQKD
ncbi:MAG: hypothetical protein KGQ70_04610, partial [Alphaproteobacteria bacterium]|nr:hypothetical protein [Alphaproteobacteria bacterium]